jgi:integrase
MAKPFSQLEVNKIRKMLSDRKSGLRDLALFNTGISTMLRTSDLLNLRVMDVADEFGEMRTEHELKMKKTGNKVVIDLDENARNSLKEWIDSENKGRSDYIFTGLGNRTPKNFPITPHQHRRLIKEWCQFAGIGTEDRSSHSIRKTRATITYQRENGSLEELKQALGHTTLKSTSRYLGVEKKEMLEVLRRNQV